MIKVEESSRIRDGYSCTGGGGEGGEKRDSPTFEPRLSPRFSTRDRGKRGFGSLRSVSGDVSGPRLRAAV